MKKPRTKKDLLADPRVVADSFEYDPGDSGLGEGGSYWLTLSEGWTSAEDPGNLRTLHEKTIADMCRAVGDALGEGER